MVATWLGSLSTLKPLCLPQTQLCHLTAGVRERERLGAQEKDAQAGRWVMSRRSEPP